MKRYSAPITKDTFDSASRFILKKLRLNIGKDRAYNLVLPLSTAVFVLFSALFTFGGIHSFSTEDDAIIFEKLKPVTDIWLFFKDLLFQDGLAWYFNVLIFVAFLFLLPAAVSLVISIIFTVTAKTPDIPIPLLKSKEKAAALHAIITKKRKVISIDEEVLGIICTVIYIASMVAFTVYSIILTFDSSDLSDLPAIIIGALFVFAILSFVYYYLYLAFYHINTFACRAKSLYAYVNDVYEFWCSVDPEEAKRNEERKKQEEAKKRAASTTSSFAGMAYYEEEKKRMMRNIQNNTCNTSYHEFDMPYTHLEAKEALKNYLNSNAPSELKEEAIQRFNNHFLDNYSD